MYYWDTEARMGTAKAMDYFVEWTRRFLKTTPTISDGFELEFSSSSQAELWRLRAEPSWGTLIFELKLSWIFLTPKISHFIKKQYHLQRSKLSTWEIGKKVLTDRLDPCIISSKFLDWFSFRYSSAFTSIDKDICELEVTCISQHSSVNALLIRETTVKLKDAPICIFDPFL